MRLLAADIGGTKTLLAVVDIDEAGRVAIHEERRYASAGVEGFEALLDDFVEGPGIEGVQTASFAVAGPIKRTARGETAQVTNLPWRLDAQRLGQRLGIGAVHLINDFEAVGYAIETLGAEDLWALQAARVRGEAPCVVLGAGTGLGIAQLVWAGDHYHVMPSEGGHVDFAPNGPEQIGLLQFLAERYGHVSVERVLSGGGLVNVFEYLCVHHPGEVDRGMGERMEAQDPAAAIAAQAEQDPESLAAHAMDLFVSVYGAHAGNLALAALPYGGVYVAGGIAPKILERLSDGRFIEAFNDKGRMAALTAEIPVFAVTNTRVGLLGAANAGRLMSRA